MRIMGHRGPTTEDFRWARACGMIAAMGPVFRPQPFRPPARQRPRPALVGTTDGYARPVGATDCDFGTGPGLRRAAGYKRRARFNLGSYKRAE